MNDILEDQEFYELMQTYRWSELPINGAITSGNAAEAFEAVKKYIRANCVVPLAEEVRTEPATGTAE